MTDVPDDIQEMPRTNRPGDRWAVLKKTSPSGKTMFRCLSCGQEHIAPQKMCWKTKKVTQGNFGADGNEREPNIECLTWQRVKLWRYYLPNDPNDRHQGWAIIVIGSDGYFSAVSDYGNYAFWWSHPGTKDFRQFLLRSQESWDYFCGKLGTQEYDGKTTCESVKRRIIDARKDGFFTKEEARKEWDLLSSNEWLESEMNYNDWMRETELSDAWEHHTESYPIHLEMFVKKTMKRLGDLLEAELKKEGLLP